jgi:hypothetical protein
MLDKRTADLSSLSRALTADVEELCTVARRLCNFMPREPASTQKSAMIPTPNKVSRKKSTSNVPLEPAVVASYPPIRVAAPANDASTPGARTKPSEARR